MVQDITYNGYTAQPSDYESPDGELSGAYNMVQESGALRVVPTPPSLFTLPEHCEVALIHTVTGAGVTSKNYIFLEHRHYDEQTPAYIEENKYIYPYPRIEADGNIINRGDIREYSGYILKLFRVNAGELWTISNYQDVVTNTLLYATYDCDDVADIKGETLYLYGIKTPKGKYEVEFTIPKGAKWLAVASYVKGVQSIKKKMCDDQLHWAYAEDLEPDEEPIYGAFYSFGDADVYSCHAIGNTIVALASDGTHYFLWKEDDYLNLGTHLPECPIKFELAVSAEYAGDEETVIHENRAADDKDLSREVFNATMASANSLLAKIADKHLFVFPFFVRYAYKLYDGSHTMHSAPCLLLTTRDSNLTTTIEGYSKVGSSDRVTYDDDELTIKTTATAYVLTHMANKAARETILDTWGDIIVGVDIYISKPIYTYDQAVEFESRYFYNQRLPNIGTKSITDDALSASLFYLAASLTPDELFTTDDGTEYSPSMGGGNRPRPNVAHGKIEIAFPTNADNIVVRERLEDDYDSHDSMIAESGYAFNSRLNLAGLKKRFFEGFIPSTMWWCANEDDHTTAAYAIVELQVDGRTIYVKSGSGGMQIDCAPVWFYYPSDKAKCAYVVKGSTTYVLPLKLHPDLNGAYYLNIDGAEVASDVAVPDATRDDFCIQSLPAKIYTSEVNNPFVFPLSGITTVGNSKIMAISAAVRALSQGQFGQFPLYAFTSDGVWALQTTGTGTYSSVQPITRDVCINPASITQLDDSVLFLSDKGIMQLSGSDTRCISTAIDADGEFAWSTLPGLTGLISNTPVVPFKQYCDSDLRMCYDYAHSRLIVFNKNYAYCYVLSMDTNKWSMLEACYSHTVNSYPNALIQRNDGKVVDMSGKYDVNEVVNGVVITRPIKLGQPDVLKTIRAVLQRGKFKRGSIRTMLYGSRDLWNWFLVGTSSDDKLRGMTGTPYKYFRLVLLCSMTREESVHGCTIEYLLKYTNKLR